METPNTPDELINMQKGAETLTEDPLAFWSLVEEIMDEELPSPYQTVKAVEKLLDRLHQYHFDTIESFDKDSNAWCKRLWKEDFKALGKALKNVRLVHPD